MRIEIRSSLMKELKLCDKLILSDVLYDWGFCNQNAKVVNLLTDCDL